MFNIDWSNSFTVEPNAKSKKYLILNENPFFLHIHEISRPIFTLWTGSFSTQKHQNTIINGLKLIRLQFGKGYWENHLI